MDESVGSSLPFDILQPLFAYTKLSSPIEALEFLVKVSRCADGRTDLSSKNVLPWILRLIQELSQQPSSELLIPCLRLMRNLCAGETINQDAFIEQNGVGIASTVLWALMRSPAVECGTVRLVLQVLANVSLAGESHQRTIWAQLFPKEFVVLARIRSRDTIDPLCMILYTCQDGSCALVRELCSGPGLSIVEEIVRTASIVGFGEEWFKLLISVICLEEANLPALFSKLSAIHELDDCKDLQVEGDAFLPEQAFLLSIVSGIVNERLDDFTVPSGFASYILGLFRKASGLVDFSSRNKSCLPTGSPLIDVLGHTLTVLRDICAQDKLRRNEENVENATSKLLSLGLMDLLLNLLRELEPPAIIRRAIVQGKEQDHRNSKQVKQCPYKGFRRDIVAVIGNCLYRRKSVQDDVRHKDGIILLLQQCVADEDNPFLREWGIWAVRNLLEGNMDNQVAVAELELRGPVSSPEVTELGLRVEVDHRTGRARLVNDA